MPPLLAAFLLVAHGLVHASYAAPAPPAGGGGPAWPFYLDRSWALSPLGLDASATRAVGLVLIGAVVTGYAVAALAVVGAAPDAWFAPAVVAASILSAALLALFFTPWIILGFAIDVVLIAGILVTGWRPGTPL